MATLPAQKQSNSNKKDTHLKTSPSNTTEGSSKEIVIEQVTVNVFFDGTKNNLYNTDTYNNSNNKTQYEKSDDYESYTNAYSNVAHLYQGRDKKSKDFWVYIEGIGSLKDNKDDQDGFAFGNNSTGVETRARLAFSEIQKKIKNKFKENVKPKILKINVFGFSRGAATARHFVHLAKSQPHLFIGWPLKSNLIKIMFVGIFDTVSSYDPSKTAKTLFGKADVIWNGSDFSNDVQELHLNFSKDYAEKVFHICASDEYRIFFSLTNIESARRLGCGYEVYLPGAHADIGGSYQDAKPNSYPVSSDPVLKKWFYQQGIFLEKDLVIKDYPQSPRNYIPPSEKLIRSSVSNAYYKVPLKTMRLMAEEFAGMTFSAKYFDNQYQCSGQILQLMAQVPKTVLAKVRWTGGPENFAYLYQNLPNFRNKYVHCSARYETGYHMRRGANSKGMSDTKAVINSFNHADAQELPYRIIWPG